MSKLARRQLFQGIAGALLGRAVAPEPVKEAIMQVARSADGLWSVAANMNIIAGSIYAQYKSRI